VAKYQLSPVQRVSYGIPSQYGTGDTFYVCDSTWEIALARLLHTIISSTVVTEPVMVACGDVALFVIVLQGKERFAQSESERPGLLFSGGKKRPYWLLGPLGESETWKSLMEMSRGRGNDFALKLIRQELQEWLRSDGVEPLRMRYESLSA